MQTRSLVIAALVAAGCSKGSSREEVRREPAAKGEPEVVPGRPGNETDEQIRAEVEALEAAAQRGEIQWSRTQGHDLLTLGKDGTVKTQPFPVPKHDHGDSINGAWLAPDGTLFTAGYAITGVPGPDTGAIHRMAPGGKLERVFDLPERELWGISGRSATDVYAIGPKTALHFDGKAWTELSTDGVQGSINTVVVTATDVWIVAVKNDPEESRIYKRAGSAWKQDAELPCLLRGLSAAGTTLYAAGACNAVFRRGPDGKWKTERIPEGGAFDIVAVSPAIAYVAAEQFLRRNADGTWVVVDASFPRVHSVYRGRGENVFVIGNYEKSGGPSGVAEGSGDVFKRTALEDCSDITFNADVTYCVRERMVASEPPADLRKR